MPLHILSPLASQLDGAFRMVETLVLRTKDNQVYTIDIGESMFNATHAYGAKITLAGPTNRHVGVCYGSSIDQVATQAQHRVSDELAGAASPRVPQPHIAAASNVTV